MNKNLKEKLHEAVEAHKKGFLKDAEIAYNYILENDSKSSDANNNLGLIKVSNFESIESLSYFKKAIELNPKNENFWFNYITALINTEKYEKAKIILKQCKEKNFNKNNIDYLSSKLLTPNEFLSNGKIYQANIGNYYDFLRVVHKKKFNVYFEIGSRTGDSLFLSQSPSIAIDPFYELKKNPIGKKDFCLLFQETSDSFFENSFPKIKNFECEFGFIDGMHLFENALKDFINLAKITSEKSLILIHDILPWTFEMATRDYKSIPKGKPWTGDVWKLIPIFIDKMKKNLPVTINGGHQTRDFIFVDDVVEIIALSMKRAQSKKVCDVFNVGTGRSINIDYLFKIIKQRIPNKSKIIKKSLDKFDPKKSSGNFNKLKKYILNKNFTFTKLEEGIDKILNNKI